MRQSQQLIGMPIISIMDGKEIGKVKSLLVNPESGKVEFLVIHNERWTLGVKVLPFRQVQGLGDYAVMTESESAVIDLSEDTLANELKTKGVSIIGNRVITAAGQFLGEVVEYYVNAESGKVEGCVVEKESNDQQVLNAEFIITMGKEILIVKKESVENLINKSEFDHMSVPQANQEEVDRVDKPLIFSKDTVNITGKRVTADVYDENGDVIVPEGEVVTEDIVERVKRIGRNKLVELTLKIAE
ncbi:PRC-barrel domain-containing protein [Aneurinibacillus aneurinilyticus]|nr:PRC-barrel domain-containing protein [Aneurinibacillus aneurinilyticus]MED0706627.1 PRC-barrel domain-containing protein [Aneurinibacillus aneurinilyticus]MED0724528.1 PRC-barrel domain-containing protein [Aneurinibacillus aneurinilyticus]MED0731174.1 PRC-barrel domain-containing protein [Aneurinibacillus aneurinilyticus]MED0743816.1 PRC-barrel domain-containing protein [Aneurinibacillus aneurinilyticus]